MIDQLILLLGEHTEVPVSARTDLVNDLALESVQIMAFVTDVEDHFDIAIELEALGTIRKLDELAAVVTEELAK
ncbi:MAG: acyl carrier protein [Pseudomonadales bacterium]